MDVRPASIQEVKEFTNLLAVREYIDDLIKYCFGMYESFSKTVQEDEAKNEQLKFELRNYQFHHSYSADCNVYVYGSNGNTYKTYDAFAMALKSGHVQGITNLSITLDLSFRRGGYNTLEDHNHKFEMKFRPELASFSYEANYEDPAMSGIRDKLMAKMEDFPATTTIFSRAN